jgi:hypothetical protein
MFELIDCDVSIHSLNRSIRNDTFGSLRIV